jgi:hypothetical protein
MRKLGRSFLLSLIATAAVAKTAWGANERLLVVVESAPDVGVDARDVRHTIGAELGIPVVAPTDATAAAASNVLIVSVDRTDIRMSLRGSAAGLVARTIPSPLDRPARLRRIGWLAGNLARDQVSGIVAVPAERAAAPVAEGQVLGTAEVAPATEPPPGVPTPTGTPSTSVSEPAATLAARAVAPVTAQGPSWTITAAGGQTASYLTGGGDWTLLRNSIYQLEVQRQTSPESLFFGAALDVGANTNTFGPVIGLAGLVGTRWQRRRWFTEASAGVGLEMARLPQTAPSAFP